MKLILVDRRAEAAVLPLTEARLGDLVEALGKPEWELNLVLVDDREMADLNGRWYGGEGPTDVLSFSYLEETGAGEPDLHAGSIGAARALWVPRGEAPTTLTAGEVVLAPAFVARRARGGGWDLAAEWALLLAHGALHVLGWRHDTAAERQAMRDQEAAILASAGFAHPLSPRSRED